jgi:hypothetical protein
VRHTLSRIGTCTSIIAVVGAMSLPLVAAGTVAGASVRPSAPLSRMQIARNFISHLKIGPPRQVSGMNVADSGSSDISSTWSGYADTPSTPASAYTQVSATWTQPSAQCPATGITMAVFWVGLDGFTSDPVEQDGTLIECFEGYASYADFWEVYPRDNVEFEHSVRAGDSITSSVSQVGTSYTFTVTDHTRRSASFTTTLTCRRCANSGAPSSAEWISVAPCCKNAAGALYNLANFKKWTLTGAAETYDGTAGNIKSGPKVNKAVMKDSKGRVQEQPSGLTGSGTSFTDTWKSAT